MRNVPDLLCLDCVAYRNYRTDSLGLMIQNGAEFRFVTWEDITDAETVDAPETRQSYYILATRDGDALDVPYDNSHFAASLWQHLRTRGLHWFVDLSVEVENFWWPIPERTPYEMKWKCRNRRLRRMDDAAVAFVMTSDGFEAKTAAGVVRSLDGASTRNHQTASRCQAACLPQYAA